MRQGAEVLGLTDMVAATARVLRRLSLLSDCVKDRALAHAGSDLVVNTRLQVIFSERFADDHEQRIYELIMTHALAAERLGPGGFDGCIRALLEKIARLRDGDTTITQLKSTSDIVGPGGRRPSQEDINWVIREYGGLLSPLTRAMTLQALQLAGFAGRIFVERARNRPSVELVRGYSFNLAPAWSLSVRLSEPRIVCIDGYVEAVSELHRLLQAASDEKQAIIVFVRGMSDEVMHTLRVNYDRGTLKVIPVIVRFDLDGINTLNDVCVVSGSDLVSSLKGDLISSVGLDRATLVDSVVIGHDRIIIVNPRTHRAVTAHVGMLRDKRATVVDDVGKLLDDRVKSLSPNQVIIRLPDDADFVALAQGVDYVLRAFRSLVDHGTCLDSTGDRSLVTTAIASEVHSHRCLVALLGLGASVTRLACCSADRGRSGTAAPSERQPDQPQSP